MKKLITLAVLIAATLTAQAQYIPVIDNIRYICHISERTAEVIGLTDDFSGTELTIPKSITYSGVNYTVTVIQENLNINTSIIPDTKKSQITKVNIKGCISIGNYAFANCTNLKTVTFDNDCGLQSIARYAFYGCTALEEISIPASVTSIGTSAFSNCSNLTTVNFSCPALTTINEAAFENCKSLTFIDLSACTALAQIGKNAFRYCSAARYIKLPNSIVNGNYSGVNQAAFVGCTGSLDLSENTLNDATVIPFINTYFYRIGSSEPLSGGKFDKNSFVYLPKTYTGTKPKGGIYDNETNIAYWDGAKWVCPRFEIEDGSAINLKYDVTAEKVIYQRSGISASTAYSICLPWAPQTSYSADGFSGKYYQLNGVSGSTIYFSEVTEPEANTPYLFITGDDWTASYYEMNGEYYSEAQNVALKATPAEMSITKNGYKMTGTFAELDKDETAGKYVLQSDASWQKSDEAIDGVTIPAFNAYIVGPESSPSLLSVAFGEVPTTATAIQTKDLDGTEQWYDLHGRRLSAPQRGINISSKGKKVMIK
ncbi:MAG: leucine-rich repeat domain-containing protein [Paludibacteraceae bacterium]|nr:leucine-rich repeat domain-containing protein [Paludibacteraceae bacterium]